MVYLEMSDQVSLLVIMLGMVLLKLRIFLDRIRFLVKLVGEEVIIDG